MSRYLNWKHCSVMKEIDKITKDARHHLTAVHVMSDSLGWVSRQFSTQYRQKRLEGVHHRDSNFADQLQQTDDIVRQNYHWHVDCLVREKITALSAGTGSNCAAYFGSNFERITIQWFDNLSVR